MFLEVWLSNRILAQHCDRIETSHNGFHSFSQVWVAHVHNPSTQDAEVEKHHEFKASLDYLWSPGYPGLQNEIQSKTNNFESIKQVNNNM